MQKLENLLIDVGHNIRDALLAINTNGCGICFVTENDVLVGVITDGDIRRTLLKNNTLECPIAHVMNRNFVSLPVNSVEAKIRQSFSSTIKLVPLCDQQGKVVDVADVLRSHRIPVLEPELTGNELEYVQDCINTNWISSQGSYVKRFETIFEELHPGMHALAVSNGTVALHLALAAIGVSEGDEVIVPDLTFAATINAVIYCKAVPVICEIDPNTWCIDPKELEKLITPKTKAIMPVHLYGQVCQMDILCELVQKHDVFMVEDCAEALGSLWNHEPVGIFGDAATFSFFGNKMISTGEGGMVLFRDHEIKQNAQILRDHGMSSKKRYWHETVGYNYRITNIQAAIGVAQMERFPLILKKKQDVAYFYNKCLSGSVGIDRMPAEIESVFHSHWLYTIILLENINRDKVIDKLMQHGIDTRPVFYSMHLMPPYKNFRRSKILSNSINVSKSGISLPSSVTLGYEEVAYISNILKTILMEEF